MCVRAALADEVAAVGGIAAASAEIGVSDDTLRRWLAGSNGDWNAGAVGAMVAAGLARNGRSLLLGRLNALAAGTTPTGDRRRALSGTAGALPALLTEAQRMATAAADGVIDRAEAGDILRDLPALIKSLEAIQGDLLDLLKNP
jgi:hypothetical protein